MDNNEKKPSLTELLIEVLGADFDAEKTKALESKINAFIGTATVPKAVFNETNTKLKDIKTKLQQRADEQKDANAWKKQIEDIKAEYEKQLKDKEENYNNYRLNQYLVEQKAKNPKAVMALLDKSKIAFDNDTITGIDEQLEALKKGNDAFLFDIPANSVQKGAGFPANPGQPSGEQKPVTKVI